MSGCGLFINVNWFYKRDQVALFSKEYDPDESDQLLHNGGYFSYDFENPHFDIDSGPFTKPCYFGYIFYDDGTFAAVSVNLDCDKNVGSKANDECYSDLVGIYKVSNDTVTCDTYMNLYYCSWFLTRKQYKIIDKTILKYISKDIINKKKITKLDMSDMNWFYRFVPLSEYPPLSWTRVKKQKWLWDNKKDWKECKRELKNYRKPDRQEVLRIHDQILDSIKKYTPAK